MNKSQSCKKATALIILDGWGIAPVWGGNAISLAEVKNFTEASKKYPYTTLQASGEGVGLPAGSPGNSEAGHLNVGAGHIVFQDQPIIDKEINDGKFLTNEALLNCFEHVKKNNSNMHFVGLMSKSGIHSHISHLYALLEMAKKQNVENVFIHLFGDGRDSDTMAGIELFQEVENKIKEIGVGCVASIVGRFYAMDRDNRWDRVYKAYELLVHGKGKNFRSGTAIFSDSYAHGITDEFIEPSCIANKTNSIITINNGDGVIFFNFRADRARELIRAFVDTSCPGHENHAILKDLCLVTFAIYDNDGFAKRAFSPLPVVEPIGKIWSDNGLRQYHTAETEKYAHVTYYFNGGREKPFPGEDRFMVSSSKLFKTYDHIPEMSAKEVTDTLIEAIDKNIYDTFVINFANPDMVGHTGDLKATVKAVEFVDHCLGRVLRRILECNGTAFIFADHGNAEQMVNPRTGAPDTEHTTNQVPFIIVDNNPSVQSLKLRQDGNLASIAPTVLDIMGIKYDKNQKEKSLIINESNNNV